MDNLTGKDPVAIANHVRGTVEFIRSGAYANLNDIAKPFGKRIDNWTRLKTTQELFDEFRREPCYSGKEPIIAIVGRNLAPSDLSKLKNMGVKEARQGTWAHPDIAIQFAQWCSPGFALWVSRQIRHLMTYSEVNLHYTEWTEDQIESGRQLNREDIWDMYGR